MIDRSQKVYFGRCIGPSGEDMGAYKIGCSHGWNERIKQVVAGLPFTIEVDAITQGGFFLEKALHIYLKEEKISGEYFHARGKVLDVVALCKKTGSPFHHIRDLGPGTVPDGALKGFMDYHGVTTSELCEYLGYKESEFVKRSAKPSFRSSTVTAAIALIAAEYGQYVSWPTDALAGLLGEESPILVRNREEEEEDDREEAA